MKLVVVGVEMVVVLDDIFVAEAEVVPVVLALRI